MADKHKLTVDLEVDQTDASRDMKKFSATVESSFEKVEKSADDAGKKVEKSSGKASKAMKGLAGVAAGLVASFATMAGAAAAASKALDFANQNRQAALLAKRLNMANAEMRAWMRTLDSMGLQQELVEDVFKDLSERIDDAVKNGGSYAEVLRDIGVNARDLAKLDASEQMLALMDALAGIEDHGLAARASMELMGDAGFQMLTAAQAGEQGLRELLSQMRDIESNKGLDQIREDSIELDKAFVALRQEWTDFAEIALSKMSPALISVAEGLTDVLAEASQGEGVLGGVADSFAGTAAKASLLLSNEGVQNKLAEDLKSVGDSALNAITGVDNLTAAVDGYFTAVKIARDAMDDMMGGSAGAGASAGPIDTSGLDPISGAMGLAPPEERKSLEEILDIINEVNEAQGTTAQTVEDTAKQANLLKAIFTGMGAASSEASTYALALGENLQEMSQHAMAALTPEEDRANRAEAASQRIIAAMQMTAVAVANEQEKQLEAEPTFHERAAAIRDEFRSRDHDEVKRYLAEQTAAEDEAMRRNAIIWQSGMKGKLQITEGILGQISGLMESENKTAFEVGKAASIAQTIIAGITGSMEAYKAMAGIPYVGPALGAAAAAAVLATSAMNVQKIKNTKFGGGGSGGGATPQTASTTGGAGAGAPSGGGGGAAAAPAAVNQTDVNLSLQGDFFTIDQVRQLGASLNELSGDNFTIRSN